MGSLGRRSRRNRAGIDRLVPDAGFHLGAPHLGDLVDLGSQANHNRPPFCDVHRLSYIKKVDRRSGTKSQVGGFRRRAYFLERAARLFFGQMVAEFASGSVKPEHDGSGDGSPLAAERLGFFGNGTFVFGHSNGIGQEEGVVGGKRSSATGRGHMIQGGWEYVIGAYAITWIVWSGYALSLWVRHRQLSKRESE